MMHFKWKTLAGDLRYVAESLLGITLEVERATLDKPFNLSVGNQKFTSNIRNAERAMRRCENVYCTMIRNEFRRVCK